MIFQDISALRVFQHAICVLCFSSLICLYVIVSFILAYQVKSDVRRLKGIPALVSMLDNPNKEVSLLIFSMAFCSFFTEVCFD